MAWLWGKIKLRSTSSTKDGEQLGYIEGSYQKLTDNFYKYLIDRKVKINLNAKITNVEKENGKYAVKYFPTIKDWQDYNWLDNFQNSTFNVNVETTIKSGNTFL